MGVPSERRPREGRADAGGARPTQFVRRSPSARGLRRPDWHPSRRPCGLGRETAAPPPHISGLRPEAERWPLPHERLKARTLARGSWEVHGRATPRTATEGRCPPTIPRNSPGNWPIIRNHIQIEDLFQTRVPLHCDTGRAGLEIGCEYGSVQIIYLLLEVLAQLVRGQH